MTVENLSSQPALHRKDKNHKIGSKETLNKRLIENQQAANQPSKEELEKAVKSLNDFIDSSRTHIQFKLHEKLNECYVTVVDDQTQEVVRKIPSKKLLDMYVAMTEFITILTGSKAPTSKRSSKKISGG
ncbi:flagellar protein FlaG [Metabacillus sp. Hm71]|uniref:flagellar protein FlaG n=1 Tax=Metabacillus sp. Hm71 TaxID=3450743 RepID=UPI003F42D98F